MTHNPDPVQSPLSPGRPAVHTDPHPWLAQWPADKRSSLANWFYEAVRGGCTTPPTIVDGVIATLHRRLQWTADFDKRQWLGQVLHSLVNDPQTAQSYASQVLAREKLPPAEKARLKAEKARVYVHAAMVGKEPTPKQLALLQAHGYRGPLPQDRAQASDIIDRLLSKGVA